MLNLKNNTIIARFKVGINGTKISRIFEGRCVKTIVLINPNRLANQYARSEEIPAKRFAPKKIAPNVTGST
jgi:hypothetical protein